MLTVITGGARSGKSRLAERFAASAGGPVTVIATAEALDADMADRIAAHRLARDPDWDVIEAPVELAEALGSVTGSTSVVVDCLTLWVANMLERSDVEIIELAQSVASVAVRRAGATIVVTNEVGGGIVPGNQTARRYRDLLGVVNRTFVDLSGQSFLAVAGRVVALKELEFGDDG